MKHELGLPGRLRTSGDFSNASWVCPYSRRCHTHHNGTVLRWCRLPATCNLREENSYIEEAATKRQDGHRLSATAHTVWGLLGIDVTKKDMAIGHSYGPDADCKQNKVHKHRAPYLFEALCVQDSRICCQEPDTRVGGCRLGAGDTYQRTRYLGES